MATMTTMASTRRSIHNPTQRVSGVPRHICTCDPGRRRVFPTGRSVRSAWSVRSVRVAARKVAVPPPSPVNIEGLCAAATGYAGLLTVYLLFVATVASVKNMGKAEQEEVTFVYSTNAVGGLSRGKRIVGSGSTLRKGGSTKQLVILLLPLIVIYAVLLVNSYSPDTLSLILPGSLKEGLSGGFNPQFIPKLANISTLFSRVGVTASLWVHLLAVNAFCAFSLMHRGIAAGIPVHHTIVLSMAFGPLGFLSSWITERLWSSF